MGGCKMIWSNIVIGSNLKHFKNTICTNAISVCSLVPLHIQSYENIRVENSSLLLALLTTEKWYEKLGLKYKKAKSKHSSNFNPFHNEKEKYQLLKNYLLTLLTKILAKTQLDFS